MHERNKSGTPSAHCEAEQMLLNSPGAEDGKVADKVIDSILLAYAVVGSMAKGQEVLLVLDIFLAPGAKPIWVKSLGVCKALYSMACMAWQPTLCRVPKAESVTHSTQHHPTSLRAQ